MPVALITGASRGLGRALARELAARGWTLVVDARHADALNTAAGEMGAGVVAVPGDVGDAAHRDALAHAVRRLGRLDLLVNNASLLGPSPLPTSTATRSTSSNASSASTSSPRWRSRNACWRT